MQIRIEATQLPGSACGPNPGMPGYRNIHVGVQRRNKPGDLLGVVSAGGSSASWTLACKASPKDNGVDLLGPYIQGPPGERFIYLTWMAGEDGRHYVMFRRAKLWLNVIPPEVLNEAERQGVLVGRLGLTDHKGNPLCASVRPPAIEWLAAAE